MKHLKMFFSLCIAILNIGLLTFVILGGVESSFSQNNRLWATEYGDIGNETGMSVATDAAGNVYLAGATSSASGIASGGFQNAYAGGAYDAFLVKFDSAGIRQWATYYGGSGDEWNNSTEGGGGGISVAADAAGNVYLGGMTNSTSGISSGGFQNACGGGFDAFLVKFDANTGNRLWATYYGGAGDDFGLALAADVSCNIYLGGVTQSTSDIASGGFQNALAGGWDNFLVKFDVNSGTRLWATYYGGTSEEWLVIFGFAVGSTSISTDSSGNVYLAGNTLSTSGIATVGSYQPVYGGGVLGFGDVFLVKFNAAGSRLWATYFGGSDAEWGCSVTTDIAGNVFLAGVTDLTSGYKSFLIKFDGSGNDLWSDFLSGSDDGGSIATDACGNIYLSATTYDTGLGFGGFQNNASGGGEDKFLMKFDAGGNRLCATYYGYGHSEDGGYVAVDGLGNVYFAGPTNGIGGDAFLAKFSSCGSSPLHAYIISSIVNCNGGTNIICSGSCTGTATAITGCGTGPYTYSWNTTPVQTTQTATGLCAGIYTATVTDAVPSTVTATVVITQPPALTTTASATAANCGSNNGSVTVNAGGGTPGYIYSWSTIPVQPTQTATGLGSGTYTATVTDANNCTTTQTVTVVSSGSITTTNQSAGICSGSSYTLPGGTVVSTGGIYTDTLASVTGCDSIIITDLTVNPGPMAVVFSIPTMSGQVITIAQGQSVTLTASGGGTYSWSSGQISSAIIITPPTTTIYCVTVTNANNCTDSVCVTVIVEPLDCSNTEELYLPNAFSPNNDGENDMLQVYYGNLQCIKTLQLTIYNRWGEEVFATQNPVAQWDGAYGGKLQNTTVFVYYLQATLISGEEISKKGNVSLIK